MKRILSLLMAMTLLVMGACALAAEPSDANGTVIPRAEDGHGLALDLDGDGVDEQVYYVMAPDDFEPFLQLHVIAADGTEAVYDTGIIAGENAWAGDLNGDGALELFLWGDIMSDDYYTDCLRYTGGKLFPILFADSNRGDNTRGYFKSGYGALEDVDPAAGTVVLSGSQDMLGTYFLNRTFRLSEGGLFEFADDGLWTREITNLEDDFWEYGGLTARVSIPCEIDGQSATLAPGDKIMITGTDKAETVTFITKDGRSGALHVQKNWSAGWGVTVNDVPEEELFEFLPYAD